MNNIAFSIAGFSIYWYSILIVVGIVLAMLITIPEIKRQKISKDFFFNLVFYVVVFGILGARIYYVLFNFDYYLLNPLEIFKVWHGGLAIHGGILVGIVVTYIYSKKNQYNPLNLIDIMVTGVILAQAIGRWGNFFNQEAYGMITTRESLVSLYIPKFIIDGMYINGLYYQPTFLYESIWNFIGFLTLFFLRKNASENIGKLTGIYLVWYSIGRIFIENYRSDSLMLGSIKVAQLVSIILIIVGMTLILKSKKKKCN